MFCNLLFALFFGGYFSIYASEATMRLSSAEPVQILLDACSWSSVAAHVADDAGVYHCSSQILGDHITLCDFEGVLICPQLSNFRCATCLAMTTNPNVNEDILTTALKECHQSEVYQVFVAADSYYKGRGDSQNFQKLKDHLPEDLRSTDTLLLNKPLLARTIRKHQSNIFERDLTWLRLWTSSHERLSHFLNHDITPPTADAFSEFMRLCDNNPYILHHLEISDFQKYAHALIPMLLKEDHLSKFSKKMHKSFSGDPQKKELFTLIRNLTNLLPFFAPPRPHAIKDHCRTAVHNIWSLLESLNAHVSPEQWEHCVTYLRQSLPWLDEAFKNNYDWIPAVFAHKKHPQKALSSTTAFDYYTKHHAPCILTIHERILGALYQQLEQHCSPEETESCENWLRSINPEGISHNLGLQISRCAFENFRIIRCRILWKLAKESAAPSPDFIYLHSMCSQAEKRALRLNAQYKMLENTIGKSLLTNVTLPDPEKDLSRISLARLFDTKL